MTPLEELVVIVDSRHGLDGTSEWVQVLGTWPDHELVSDHHLGRLLGFVARRRCSAIAMTAPGWARSTEAPAGQVRQDRQRIRVTCAVARHGEVAGRIRWPDGTQVDDPPGSGRALDILRRCLRLPTEPPPVPSGHLLAAQWLEAVRQAAERSARPLTWEQVAVEHPAMRLALQEGLPIGPDNLVQVASLAAQVWTWSELLRQASERGPLADALPPDTGRWMDEGMLARWLLAPYPPLADHVGIVAGLVMPSTAHRLAQALELLGLSIEGPALREEGFELSGEVVADGQ
jgi:hypothetical protein